MATNYEPPDDASDLFAQYKAHYEGERELKPVMREMAARELQAGATVGRLAKLTGLTPEVFRRMARDLGVERKRPPTVGKLKPEPAAAAHPQHRAAAYADTPTAAPKPLPKGRPLSELEAKNLADIARTRADPRQLNRLEQDAAQVSDGLKDYTVVSSALDMRLLTHVEVYDTDQPDPGNGT